MTLVAVYAIAVAILIAGMWAASLATGGVPELRTKPWEIRHHIAAELLLALTLAAGGVMSLAGVGPGQVTLALGLGMALYSIVNSSGYYVERRQVPVVAMFGGLLVLTALAAGYVAALG